MPYIGIVAVMFAMFISMISAHQNTMHQAHERGYAVQCPGKVGYYWECN
jgi:hypothetical protein